MTDTPDATYSFLDGTIPAAHPLIAIVTDGDTLWLQCFAGDPDAEHGVIITPVEPGDKWFDLAAKVDQHIIGHGC